MRGKVFEACVSKKVGLLTAKHVVGQRILGNPFPLTKGLGRLLDVAPEGLDAALIQVPRAQLPSHLHAFGAQTHIAQWIDVQVYGSESGVWSCSKRVSREGAPERALWTTLANLFVNCAPVPTFWRFLEQRFLRASSARTQPVMSAAKLIKR